MKTFLSLAATCLCLGLAACSSPDTRIQKNPAAFNSWPAEVQQKVRAGQVDVGYTEEMVALALGEPDGKSVRTTEDGTFEVWMYVDRGPHFSIGVGAGTAGGGTGFGGGVTVGNDGFRNEELMRVVFSQGKVTAVERRKK